MDIAKYFFNPPDIFMKKLWKINKLAQNFVSRKTIPKILKLFHCPHYGMEAIYIPLTMMAPNSKVSTSVSLHFITKCLLSFYSRVQTLGILQENWRLFLKIRKLWICCLNLKRSLVKALLVLTKTFDPVGSRMDQMV